MRGGEVSDEQERALAAEAVKDERRWTLHEWDNGLVTAHRGEPPCTYCRSERNRRDSVVVPLSALEAANAEADRWSVEANDRGVRLEAAERERDEAEEHIRQFHSAAAKARIEKLERNASELELLRQAATEWEDCTQSYIARIEKLEAALHTATELLRGISEENLAMSTPSLVAADAFLAALDEEGGGDGNED